MRNKMLGRLIAATISVTTLYAATGCNEPTLLGQNLIPGSFRTEAQETDTFTVQVKTFYRPDDSLVANYQTQMVAGAINSDPEFGKTTAITYAQYGLPSSAFAYTGTDPVLDSVVVSYAYAGYYGDSLGQQTFSVYKIDDPAFSDTTLYFMHQKLPIANFSLGTATVSPNTLKDSVNIFGTMEPPQLRIRLNNSLGQLLMQQSATGAFATDSAFHQLLNGLALVPDSTTPGRSSLVYLELNNTSSGITVYYHNSTKDSLQAFFPFRVTTGAFSNYLVRNYSGSQAAMHFGDTTNTTGDSLIYLQSSPGLYANVAIPYLQNFPNSVINKAELVITQIPDNSFSVFSAPSYLFLYKYSNAAMDSLTYVYDAGAIPSSLTGRVQFSNLAYFGGVKHIITNSNGQQVAQYRINITRDFQHLISNNPAYPEFNYGFRLVVMDPSGQTMDPGRVIVGGGNKINYRMKLHVIYTKIQ